jgi:hypothetical protein
MAALAAVSAWTFVAPARAQAPPAAAVDTAPARMPAGAYPVFVVLPSELPWAPGQPVVPGYKVIKKRRSALILAGALTLGAMWTGTAIWASFAVTYTGDPYRENYPQGGDGGLPYAPLFVPVVGPFIALGTDSTKELGGFGEYWLVMDGLVQVAGAAMLIAGLAASTHVLVPSVAVPGGAVSLVPTPVRFSGGGQGLGLTGTF